MEVSGDYVFDAPQQIVWEALQDPNVLGSIVPGGQGFEQMGENEYKGVLLIKVGPVQGTFQGQIKLSDIVPPQSYKIEVDGKGAPGFMKGAGAIQLEAQGNQTAMKYSGQAQVGGRIASVGQRLLDTSARSIIRHSLDALNEYLKVKVAQQAIQEQAPVAASAAPSADHVSAAAAPPPPVALPQYKPPSQMAMGFKVARDVLKDMIPAKYQPVVMGAVIVVLALIIWLIFLR